MEIEVKFILPGSFSLHVSLKTNRNYIIDKFYSGITLITYGVIGTVSRPI